MSYRPLTKKTFPRCRCWYSPRTARNTLGWVEGVCWGPMWCPRCCDILVRRRRRLLLLLLLSCCCFYCCCFYCCCLINQSTHSTPFLHSPLFTSCPSTRFPPPSPIFPPLLLFPHRPSSPPPLSDAPEWKDSVENGAPNVGCVSAITAVAVGEVTVTQFTSFAFEKVSKGRREKRGGRLR